MRTVSFGGSSIDRGMLDLPLRASNAQDHFAKRHAVARSDVLDHEGHDLLLPCLSFIVDAGVEFRNEILCTARISHEHMVSRTIFVLFPQLAKGVPAGRQK